MARETGEHEQHEEIHFHARERRPDEPVGSRHQDRREGGARRREVEPPRDGVDQQDAPRLGRDAGGLRPEEERARQTREQPQKGRPERRRRAGHELPGIERQTLAVREAAGEDEMDIAVVERQLPVAVEEPGLGGEEEERRQERDEEQQAAASARRSQGSGAIERWGFRRAEGGNQSAAMIAERREDRSR